MKKIVYKDCGVFSAWQLRDAEADGRLIRVDDPNWTTGPSSEPVRFGIVSESKDRIDWDNGSFWTKVEGSATAFRAEGGGVAHMRK